MKIKHISGEYKAVTRECLVRHEANFINIRLSKSYELGVAFFFAYDELSIIFNWISWDPEYDYPNEKTVRTYGVPMNYEKIDNSYDCSVDLIYLAILDELYRNGCDFPSKSKRDELQNVVHTITTKMRTFNRVLCAILDRVFDCDAFNGEEDNLRFRVMKRDAIDSIIQHVHDKANTLIENVCDDHQIEFRNGFLRFDVRTDVINTYVDNLIRTWDAYGEEYVITDEDVLSHLGTTNGDRYDVLKIIKCDIKRSYYAKYVTNTFDSTWKLYDNFIDDPKNTMIEMIKSLKGETK